MLESFIREYQDFPQDGILFRDITPLLENRFSEVMDELYNALSVDIWQKADAIAGVEARGFTLAAGMAARLGKNVIQIRKAGKLPGDTMRINYGLEYGNDALEMHHGKGNVIIMDDVLATGGTLEAAAQLCANTGRNVIGLLVLIDLVSLNSFEWNGLFAHSVLKYK